MASIRMNLPGRFVLVLLAVTVTLLLLSDNALAFPRRVLFEDFGSTTCPPCATAAPEVEAAMQATEDICTPIGYHMNWPPPGNDPWYEDNSDDNNIRRTYYGVGGIPAYFIDGVAYDSARTRGKITEAIQRQRNVSSPLEMVLEGHVVRGVLQVDLTIRSEQAVNNSRVFVALNEDHYYYRGPSGQNDHYDAMVKMLPNGNGTNFAIEADAESSLQFELELEGLGWHNLEIPNLIVIAWVQRNTGAVLQSALVNLELEEPFITFESTTVTEGEGGNDDGRPEAGEQGYVVFEIANDEAYLTAENILVTLSTEDPDIQIVNSEIQIESLENGSSISNADSPLIFGVGEEFSAHPVTFTLTLTAQPHDFATQIEITSMVDWPPYLMVDATADVDAGAQVYSQFGTEEVPWADRYVKVVNEITAEQLQRYEVVFWHSFNNWEDVATNREKQALEGYLDHGGTLIMTGVYLPRALASSRLLSDYIGAELVSEDNRYAYVLGYESDPIFGDASLILGGEGAIRDPSTLPVIRSNGVGEEVLHYEHLERDRGACGIQHQTETYKVLLLSFPFESISGQGETEDRTRFMFRLMDWVNNELDAPAERVEAPVSFALLPAFPNPFNSTSTITFGLDATGHVDLKVFDLAGREIATLISGNMAAGSHHVSWNAGAGKISEGVYLLRLDAGSRSAAQKLLYLK